MNESVRFGEIDVIPVADSWEPPDVAGCRVPLLPFTGEGLTIGPEPGYSVGSDGPFGALPYPDAGDQRSLAVIVAGAPVEIGHAFYGETVVPAGTWQLRLRHTATAAGEH
jgi:hypothetical protein